MSTQQEDDEFFHSLEREIFDAFEAPGNPDTIERLYSSEFLAINADGSKSDKQAAIEIVDAGVFPVCETVENDESHVRRFDDTAIITGRSKWVDPDGEFTTTVRHTQTWVNDDGQWQMVGWQGTPVAGEKAAGPDL